MVQVVKKQQQKKGKGGSGFGWEKNQTGRTETGSMPQLWRRPLLVGLQGVEGNQRKTPFFLGKLKAQPLRPYGRVTGMEPLDQQMAEREAIGEYHHRIETVEGNTEWVKK